MSKRDYVEVRITLACREEHSSSKNKLFSNDDSPVDELGNAIANSLDGVNHPRPFQVLAQAVVNFREIVGELPEETEFVDAALKLLHAWEAKKENFNVEAMRIMVTNP